MALIRNIAGLSKLGNLSPDMDMQKMMDENYGGGSYYDPVYPEVPLGDPVRPSDGPMPVDYGGGGGDTSLPEDIYGPDNTGGEPGPSDQQPVYPILPIRGYEEVPPPAPEVLNTVNLAPAAGGQTVDLGALGVLGGILFMSLAGVRKDVWGGVCYAGALGMLYLRLKNARTVQVQPQQPVTE
jgi:hypothetical protein